MSNQIAKILSIFVAVLFAITAILGLLFYIYIAPLEIPAQVNLDKDIPAELMKYINWILMYTLILLVAVIFVSFVVNPILKVVSSPKSVIRSAIGIVTLVIVVGIAYSLSSDEPVKLIQEISPDALAKQVVLADTALYSSYILTVLIFLAIIASNVKNLLKL